MKFTPQLVRFPADCQPEGPEFNPRPCRGLKFGRLSLTTPSVDRDFKPLVLSLDVLLGDLRADPRTVVDKSRLMRCCGQVTTSPGNGARPRRDHYPIAFAPAEYHIQQML